MTIYGKVLNSLSPVLVISETEGVLLLVRTLTACNRGLNCERCEQVFRHAFTDCLHSE